MNATIAFKNEKYADVHNLKEVYAGAICVPKPYDNLLLPNTALTFVGDTTVCSSNDVLLVTID